jgi:hypothetical protein
MKSYFKGFLLVAALEIGCMAVVEAAAKKTWTVLNNTLQTVTLTYNLGGGAQPPVTVPVGTSTVSFNTASGFFPSNIACQPTGVATLDITSYTITVTPSPSIAPSSQNSIYFVKNISSNAINLGFITQDGAVNATGLIAPNSGALPLWDGGNYPLIIAGTPTLISGAGVISVANGVITIKDLAVAKSLAETLSAVPSVETQNASAD